MTPPTAREAARARELLSRAVPEWRGATPDAAIPKRVRLRVFQRYGGRCYLTGQLIRPGDKWDLDHIIALANGGEHAEHNLAPALKAAHRAKTAQDVDTKAKIARVRAKHLGLSKSSRGIRAWRKFDGTPVYKKT